MKIVIEGAGEIGSHLAKMLREEANEVTVIDNDPVRLSTLGGYADVETFLGSPSSIKALRDAGVARADLFIAVYPFTPPRTASSSKNWELNSCSIPRRAPQTKS